MRDLRWSELEDNIIREFYPSEGADAALRLPDRSKSAVIMRARFLGVKWERQRKYSYWTPEEDRVLLNFYPEEGSRVVERLKDRTPSAVISRARELHISCNDRSGWDPKEDEILSRYYRTEGVRVKERLPGRSGDAVRNRAFVLGLSESKDNWTPEEDRILMDHYPSEGTKTHKRLPGRTKRSVMRRAKKLGLTAEWRVWSEEEDERIRTYYPTFRLFGCVQG